MDGWNPRKMNMAYVLSISSSSSFIGWGIFIFNLRVNAPCRYSLKVNDKGTTKKHLTLAKRWRLERNFVFEGSSTLMIYPLESFRI